jgi:hypothetical protein
LSPGVQRADGFSDFSLTEPGYRKDVLLMWDGDRVYTDVLHLVTHHSPDGHGWGYAGLGPADWRLTS